MTCEQHEPLTQSIKDLTSELRSGMTKVLNEQGKLGRQVTQAVAMAKKATRDTAWGSVERATKVIGALALIALCLWLPAKYESVKINQMYNVVVYSACGYLFTTEALLRAERMLSVGTKKTDDEE